MNTNQLAKALKALSHPNRLELFQEIVKRRETCFESDCACPLTELMRVLKIGAPTVSHHLKELVNANLVHTERRGKNIVARVNEQGYANVVAALSKHLVLKGGSK